MRTLALGIVIASLALGLGAGFTTARALAPRIVYEHSAEEVAAAAQTEEEHTVLQAVDSWVRESNKSNYLRISTYDLRAATREDNPEGGPYVILDVRDNVDWLDKHIEGATSVPLNGMTVLLDRLPPDKSTPIVTYCGDGNRGALAVAALRTLGYSNVRTLSGGLNAWLADGFPVTTYRY
ncbi:MAG TPA: rhodanese-like domain-containing protein [Chloroflexota bacterium]|nr:rhodanese-like domain-containing protein [Chloroflexota bacterium]